MERLHASPTVGPAISCLPCQGWETAAGWGRDWDRCFVFTTSPLPWRRGTRGVYRLAVFFVLSAICRRSSKAVLVPAGHALTSGNSVGDVVSVLTDRRGRRPLQPIFGFSLRLPSAIYCLPSTIYYLASTIYYLSSPVWNRLEECIRSVESPTLSSEM